MRVLGLDWDREVMVRKGESGQNVGIKPRERVGGH